MSKSLAEFKRFLAKKADGMSEHEKKLSRLILDNFTAIEAVGTASGRRGKLIAKLVEEAGDKALAELDVSEGSTGGAGGRVKSLSRIVVQNFRGFSDVHSFELKKNYTFVYGPNGTGKSSLCEAFEYSLLGSVYEAEAKRIDVAAYVRNSMTGIFATPMLYGIGTDGKEIVVEADAKAYEFCFIEKNRIDGFARVAANTATAQQTKLAALFGLEEFNQFSTQFNDHFENYLDCEGQKTKALKEKEKQIAGHRQILEQLPGKEKAIAVRAEALLCQHPGVTMLSELKVRLAGSEDDPGLIAKANAELAKLAALKAIADPSVDVIVSEVQQLSALIEERRAAKLFLATYKDQLSLRDLYLAILANKERYGNNCPACESAVLVDGKLAVPVDPYSKAEEKVKQFDEAIRKEARIVEIGKLLDSRWPALSLKIDKLQDAAKVVAFPYLLKLDPLIQAFGKVKDLKTLEEALALVVAQEEVLHALKNAVTSFNATIEKSKNESKAIETRIKALMKNLEDIAEINSSAKDAATSKEAATTAIVRFNEENEVLIKQAEAEKPTVQRNTKFLAAYKSFREKLLEYNIALPLALVTDLNERTLQFYNAINKHDHVSDLLARLVLPTESGKRIEIEFELGKKLDALQVLSEGHIRCLGLAILLAKIVRDDLPFLIFDDVVNSVDDEHRAGIIELILGNEEISRRQLIITTHGEDFVKRLENFVPKAAYKQLVNRIDFLAPMEPKKISVKFDEPRHYLVVAERMLHSGRVRDCLSHVRKSFEEMLNRLWKRTSNKGYSVQIKVGLRGPGGTPDLMSLANGLREFLSRKEVMVYKEVVPLLDKMLGRESTHAIEWNYLNKGTHEEDRNEEFDGVLVREMLALVDELDATIEKGAALALSGARSNGPIPVST